MTVFDFTDYKEFLSHSFPISGPKRGVRTRLATYLNCNQGFVSSVISGGSDFSLEHVIQISEFLELSPDEEKYFLTLVQWARAGSERLKRYFEESRQELLAKHQKISSRVANVEQPLTALDQMEYYSHWAYAVVHMAVFIPQLQDEEELRTAMRVPKKKLREVITFLVRTGLIQSADGKLLPGVVRMHLPDHSPHILRHHMNWRMRGIRSLDDASPQDLHYSAVMTLSESTMIKIRELMMKSILNVDEALKEGERTMVYSLLIDLFPVVRSKVPVT